MSGRVLLLAALFVSLALNVFIVGAFVGSRLGGEGRERPHGPVRSPVAAAVRTLPLEHQAAWREQMPEFVRDNGPRIREARRLAHETLRSLGDEPFDAEAVRADLRRARALEHESRLTMDERLVTFAATLPPEERARFGEALARPAMGDLGRRGAREGGRAGLADR